MATHWSILTLTFSLANVLLHGVGMYLLWYLRRYSRLKIQNFYLMSLSGSELLMNLLNILINLSEISDRNGKISQNLNKYLIIMNFTGIAFVFHASMIFITFDRLLELLLNIKYPVYWNEEKTKFLLICTWVFGACISITVSCFSGLHDVAFQWEKYFFTFFFPSIEIIFVVLAIATYTFIFRKFKNTRQVPVVYIPKNIGLQPPALNNNNNNNNNSNNNKVSRIENKVNINSNINSKKGKNGKLTQQHKRHQPAKRVGSCQIFIKSKFFIPVLLILTYFIFVVGADLVYLIVFVIQKKNNETIGYMLSISYAISNVIDAWIYIFLQREVRTLFMRKFYSKKSFPSVSSTVNSNVGAGGRIETIT